MDLKGRRLSIADRTHFQAHLDPENDRLFISQPMLGKGSNRWTVQYSRKILDADGSFAGVAVVSISCDDLSAFYDRARIGGGFVALVGLDGVVRGYGPVLPAVLGLDLHKTPAFQPLLSEPEGTLTLETPWDGARRIVGFRRLDQSPLVVMVGQDEATVFQQYRALRERALGIGIAATAIILLLGMVWVQQRVRSAASRRALLLTLDTMDQGIVLIEADGRVLVINRRAVTLLDLPASLLDPKRPSRQAEAEALGLSLEEATARPEALHRDGRIIETLSQALPGGGLVRTYTDVTEQRIAEARIRHMAHHDPLTGLANRILLNERIAGIGRDRTASCALLWLDLDGFKSVNDTLGHDAGDRLLREVSRRLSALAPREALVARVGGDEFAILHAGGVTPRAMETFSDAVLATLNESIDIDGTRFRLSASIGYACHPDDSLMPDLLLRHALHEFERTCANEIGVNVLALLGESFRRQHHAGAIGQHTQQRRIWARQV